MPANKLLLIKPHGFSANPETASSNVFQSKESFDKKEVSLKALAEFEEMITSLQAHKFNITVFEFPQNPYPDEVFPNNWFSSHRDGQIVLYPMLSKIRRGERREEILRSFKEDLNYSSFTDFSKYESEDKFLEGTGSIIFDHKNKIAYCVESERSDEELFMVVCNHLDYEGVFLKAKKVNGVSIYHTNVIMSVSDETVVWFPELFEVDVQDFLEEKFKDSGKRELRLSEEQLWHFTGNILNVENSEGKKFWLMSSTAYKSFNEEQKAILQKEGDLLHFNIETIEKFGGGSVRCMLAELY